MVSTPQLGTSPSDRLSELPMVVAEASVKLLPAPGSVSGFTTCAAAGKFQSLFPRELDLRDHRKGIEFCVFILYLVIAQNCKL